MRQSLHSILDTLGTVMLWAPLVAGVVLLVVAIEVDWREPYWMPCDDAPYLEIPLIEAIDTALQATPTNP